MLETERLNSLLERVETLQQQQAQQFTQQFTKPERTDSIDSFQLLNDLTNAFIKKEYNEQESNEQEFNTHVFDEQVGEQAVDEQVGEQAVNEQVVNEQVDQRHSRKQSLFNRLEDTKRQRKE
jgi:hypothetical protein